MTHTCCCCFSLRLGTIIISVIALSYYLSTPYSYNGASTLNCTISVQTLANGTTIPISKEIDVSPEGMDYVFAVLLPVVTLVMLLSATLKKSEILFYAMITLIIASILLTVYSTLGEERGWWFKHKFPPTCFPMNLHNAMPESARASGAVFGYVLKGYFMFVVYSYVQQLRQGILILEIHKPLIF